MSNTIRDAWNDEKSLGDWPFERWIFPRLELRAGVNYVGTSSCPPLQSRLRYVFGWANDEARLLDALSEAESVVEAAVDQSEAEAYEAWLQHEVWLPMLDESIRAGDEPAQMFIECVDLVGPDKFSAQELCAAVGLWCYGEYTRAHDEVRTSLISSVANPFLRYSEASVLLQQAALALAEAEWYRGKAEQEAASAKQIAKRNKASADKGHARNRERKLTGLALWNSRSWKVQADAERAIANECHITKEVAGRWIREFKRARK